MSEAVKITIDDLTATAAELRRLHAELERKSDAIQRLWKERDELRSECRTLVRQNGEWQELNAELVEALRAASNYIDALGGDSKGYRVALAKAQGEMK